MPLDGGTPQRCGPDDAQDRHPRWSPDGRRLAVISTRGGAGRRDVWVIDVETGAAHAAARAPGPVSTFDWAPDGRRFAVTVERGPETPPTPADLPYEVHSTRFMRDGIGPASGPGRREVWVVGADDEEAVRLTPDGEGSDWNPVWAPDGATIACLSDRGVDPDLSSKTGLWTMAPEGTGRRQLVEPVGPIRVARWSPDGAEIAYLGHRHGDEQGENLELWTVSVADSVTRCWSAELDRSVGHAVRGEDDRGFGTPDLAWTPDGRPDPRHRRRGWDERPALVRSRRRVGHGGRWRSLGRAVRGRGRCGGARRSRRSTPPRPATCSSWLPMAPASVA